MDQAAVERAFDAQLDPQEMSGWMERMASEPNHVGSPHDKANAEFMLAQFKSWGWDYHIEEFQVLYLDPHLRSPSNRRPRRPFRRHPDRGPHRRRSAHPDGRARAARLRRGRSTRVTVMSQHPWSTRTTACRRLQGARAPGHQRQRQDRHHPLRRRLARPETETRARARRGRMYHIFRSERRRRLPRRSVSQGRRVSSNGSPAVALSRT